MKERGFQRQARINATPEAVWAFMTNLDNSPKWIVGVSESKQTSPGPMGPGAVIRETRTLAKRTETFDIHVREFDPPRKYSAAAKAGKAEFAYSFELKDAGGSTDITMNASARAPGLFAGLFLRIGVRFMEKYDGDQLEQLKRAVEGKEPLPGAGGV